MFALGFAGPGQAQIKTAIVPDTAPDRALGTTVTKSGSDYTIDGGTRTGNNLFHSFADFSIGAGDTAIWTYTAGDPNSVARVINRVTGGEPSQIDGKITSSAIPHADFYFINPAGVVVGPKARVDVPGAAYISTAHEVRFADGAKFSAVTPSGSTLTASNPVAFGFLGGQGAISIEGVNAGFAPKNSKLSFVAADVSVSDSTIKAGQLDLIATGSKAATVDLSAPLATGFSGGDVRITDSKIATLSGSKASGSIRIGAGGTVSVTGSKILNQTVSATRGGDTVIQTKNAILDNASLANNTLTGAGGNGGNIAVNATGTVTVRNGANLMTQTFGSGTAGNVTVNVRNLQVDNGHVVSIANVDASGTIVSTGDAGTVIVTAANAVTVQDGGKIASYTLGAGDARHVFVAADRLLLDNGSIDADAGSLAVGEDSGLSPNAGTVAIVARNAVTIRNGGSVTADVVGGGNSGAVSLTAGSLAMSGGLVSASNELVPENAYGNGGAVAVHVTGAITLRDSTIAVTSYGLGSSGSVGLTADSLLVDGSFIASDSYGTGRAGGIEIAAGDVKLRDGGQIETSTYGPGNAGDISLNAASVTDDGASIRSNSLGDGRAGTIDLAIAGDVTLRNGGQIETNTAGAGNAGDVILTAASLEIDGSASGIASSSYGISQTDNGNSGAIAIRTSGAVAIQGGFLSTNAQAATGNAGNVSLTASGLTVDGGSIQSATLGAGAAGQVHVAVAGDVALQGGAQIETDTQGPGDAGSVTLTAAGLLIGHASGIASAGFDTFQEGIGNSGTISIATSDAVEIHGGFISTDAHGGGNSGDIALSAPGLAIDGGGSITSDAYGPGMGHGGRISLDIAGPLSLDGGSKIRSQTSSDGPAGSVSVTADSLALDHASLISSESVSAGNAGDVSIGVLGALMLQNSSSITSATSDAGVVTVVARDAATIESGASITTNTGGPGNAGNVSLTAASLVIDGKGVVKSSNEALFGFSDFVAGRSGTVVVTVSGRLTLSNGGQIVTNSIDRFSGGDVTVNAPDIVIDGRSSAIESSNTGQDGGAAGSITVNTDPLLLSNGGAITTNSQTGNAGAITLNFAKGGLLTLAGRELNGEITTNSATDKAGVIDIDGPAAIILNGGRIQALGPFQGAFVTLSSGAVIESSDRPNSIDVSGTLDFNSQFADISQAVTVNDLSFLDTSKVLRGRCASQFAGGGVSQMAVRLGGPYVDEAASRMPARLAALDCHHPALD